MKASSVRHTQQILKINNENPAYDFSKMILFHSILFYINLFSIFYSLFSVSGLLVHLRLDLLNRKKRERKRDIKEWEREWDRQRYRGKGRDKEVEKDRKRKKETRQSPRRKRRQDKRNKKMEGERTRRRKSLTKYWIFNGNQVIREQTKIWAEVSVWNLYWNQTEIWI